MAHADYLDLIPLTERLLSGLSNVLGSQSRLQFNSFDRLDCLSVLNDELRKLLGSHVDVADLLAEVRLLSDAHRK